MIFATDLDRTLIYSHLFLEEADCSYQLIEKKGEKPIAYMSDKAIQLFKRLHQKAHIIPVSLRNEEEFHRIQLFKELIIPEIFVTNNGGTIYYQGKEDKEWSCWIHQQMEKIAPGFDEIRQCFRRIYQGEILKELSCGSLVWLFMGEREHLDQQGLEAFRKTYCQEKWRLDISGRKIYVYPYFVTKWQAVSFIQKKYYDEPVFAAGDSIFDLEMVEKAAYGMIPKDCYIEGQIRPHVKIAAHKGMRAAEDILEEALKRAGS